MNIAKNIGNLGENAVCSYLKRKGFDVLKQNYRVQGGEIDIIAKNENYIIFVEVKTRKNLIDAFESITASKKKFILRTAQRYIYDNEIDLQPRFDVAFVAAKNNIVESIDYIENAF